MKTHRASRPVKSIGGRSSPSQLASRNASRDGNNGNDLLRNLSLATVQRLKTRAAQRWSRQQILEAIQQLKIRARQRLQNQKQQKKKRTRFGGRRIPSLSVFTGRLSSSMIAKSMTRSSSSLSLISKLTVDTYSRSDSLSSDSAKIEEESRSSSSLDPFCTPTKNSYASEEQGHRIVSSSSDVSGSGCSTRSPTGVHELLPSFSDEASILEPSSPSIPKETWPPSPGKETVSIRVSDDNDATDTLENYYDNDDESLKSSRVELELIENENRTRPIENDGSKNDRSPGLKLETERKPDAEPGDNTEQKLDELLTEVEHMFRNISQHGKEDSSLTLDNAIQLLELAVCRESSMSNANDELEDDDVTSHCKSSIVPWTELCFRYEDGDESIASQSTFRTFTTDVNKEEELGCVFSAVDHVIDIWDHAVIALIGEVEEEDESDSESSLDEGEDLNSSVFTREVP